MTDSMNWTGDSVDSMKADCETEAIRNYSRWQQVVGSEEKEPPTDIMDLICPGGCTNHGKCINGKQSIVPLILKLYDRDLLSLKGLSTQDADPF